MIVYKAYYCGYAGCYFGPAEHKKGANSAHASNVGSKLFET